MFAQKNNNTRNGPLSNLTKVIYGVKIQLEDPIQVKRFEFHLKEDKKLHAQCNGL